MNIHLLYHDNCMDGLGAAWAVWHNVKAVTDKTFVFHPYKHGDPLPDIDSGLLYVLDCCPPRAWLGAQAASGDIQRVTVIDHHPTALPELKGVICGLDAADPGGKLIACWDRESSAAVLAWRWLSSEPVPELLQYIQDRDLWRWKLPNSRAINAALYQRLLGREAQGILETMERVTGMERDWSDNLLKFHLHQQGTTILESQATIIRTLAATAGLSLYFPSGSPARYCARVNSAVLVSELGEAVLQRLPKADFVDIWHDDYARGLRIHSLRSRAGGVDVSELAKSKGGGGHPCAAGYSEPLPEEP